MWSQLLGRSMSTLCVQNLTHLLPRHFDTAFRNRVLNGCADNMFRDHPGA